MPLSSSIGRFLAWSGLLVLVATAAATSAVEAPRVRLQGHVPRKVSQSRLVSHVAPQTPVDLVITLPLTHQAQLNDFLRRAYDPKDPLNGASLTPAEFTARFGPTPADYSAVAAYAAANGLNVRKTYASRMLMDVSGPAGLVEKAFGTRLSYYAGADGKVFRAPEADPVVPAALASRITGITGFDDSARMHPHMVKMSNGGAFTAHAGPAGGLTPDGIKRAYNLSSTPLTGAGQTLALVEFDAYVATDITTYESNYAITPAVPLQNVLIDGGPGNPGSGQDEVTLDIELQIALAPGATKIIVYEAPNSLLAGLHMLDKMATDNLAKSISSSWGINEVAAGSAYAIQESAFFQQMAAQRQSFFVASGDFGAYDDDTSNTPVVDDPSGQPYVTSVGGTALATTPAGNYQSETTWNGGRNPPVGSGGGISVNWSIPSYQVGVVSAGSLGSTTKRNVPDVALMADPNTPGYSIYSGGAWTVYGGTSCAAPLWSAFIALANQNRIAAGATEVGFANPTLYTIGKGSQGQTAFHDIADNSNNLVYPAVTGYDCATGWGTFNGATLLAALQPVTVALDLDFPNGGEIVPIGRPTTISWTTTGFAANNTVKIELSRDSGATYTQTIADAAPDTGEFDWTPTGSGTNTARIRITSNVQTSITDASAADFALVQGSILLNEPVGGTVVRTGSKLTISWSTTGYASTSTTAKIELTRDAGDTWETLFSSVPNLPGDNSVEWTASGAATTVAEIRVTAVTLPLFTDTSDVFEIRGPAVLKVVSPKSGDRLNAGATATIAWTSGNFDGPVTIELSRNGGQSWEPIVVGADNFPGDNSYDWDVVGPATKLGKIRITSVDEPDTRGLSTGVFEVQVPGIQVTAPAARTTVLLNTTLNIKWNTTGLPANGDVTIELSRDGGASWDTIVDETPNTGLSQWVVSGTPSSDALVRVSSIPTGTEDPVEGVSGSFFISAPTLFLVAPNGGDKWRQGTQQVIQWTGTTVGVGKVDVQLSRDGGRRWTTIISGTANDGAQAWGVHGATSKKVRLRLIWSVDSTVVATSARNFSITAGKR